MRRVAAGLWRPGCALPSEQDLARELGVSAGTVRKALDKLAADRLVVRRQGRGTFVADQAERAGRFCKMRDRQGNTLGDEAALLEQTVGPASILEQTRLELRANEAVLRTRWMRRRGARPFMLEQACLAMNRLPGVGDQVGIYNICVLAQTHGVHLARASESIRLAQANADIAELLGAPCDTTLLQLDRVIFAVKNLPVEWRVAMCHPDQTYYLAEIA